MGKIFETARNRAKPMRNHSESVSMRSSTFVAIDFVPNGSVFLPIVAENHRISGASLGRGATAGRKRVGGGGSEQRFPDSEQ